MLTDKDATQIHHHGGVAVRRFVVEELGGTPPEQEPTPEQGIAEGRLLEAKRERKRLE